MRRMVVMMVAGLLTLQAGAASAQYNQVGGLEIIPMGGYRWGGSLSTVPGVNELKTKDDVSYGIGIGTMTPKNSEVEVMWSHFEVGKNEHDMVRICMICNDFSAGEEPFVHAGDCLCEKAQELINLH